MSGFIVFLLGVAVGHFALPRIIELVNRVLNDDEDEDDA